MLNPDHGQRLFLALGSNLGDRLANLRFARAEIERRITREPVASAAVYESAAVDCPPGSPPFLNTVVSGFAGLAPEQLLAVTQSIESSAGRPPGAVRNAPRTLDIDILLVGDLTIRSPLLTLPHPRLHLRRFVLLPLADLAPGLIVPGTGLPVAQLCEEFAGAESIPERLTSCW